MNILFIADPLATFKTYKDTTYAKPRLSNSSAQKTTTTTNGSNRKAKCRLP